jgi:hypothetical protein
VRGGKNSCLRTLLQATAVTDRWGTTHYGHLSGLLTAPASAASALAPFAGAVMAAPLGGYPHLFTALVAAVAALTAAAAATPQRQTRNGRHAQSPGSHTER